MKIKSVMLLSSLAFAFAQAQEEPVSTDAVQKVLVEKCKTSLSFLEKSIPSNAVAAKATLAEAMGTSRELDFVFSNDPLSPDVATLAKTCDIYVNLVQMQAESQSLRNHIDANWEKKRSEKKGKRKKIRLTILLLLLFVLFFLQLIFLILEFHLLIIHSLWYIR